MSEGAGRLYSLQLQRRKKTAQVAAVNPERSHPATPCMNNQNVHVMFHALVDISGLGQSIIPMYQCTVTQCLQRGRCLLLLWLKWNYSCIPLSHTQLLMPPRFDRWNSLWANFSRHFSGYDMWNARYIYIVYKECTKIGKQMVWAKQQMLQCMAKTMGCRYGRKWVSGSEACTDRKHILFTHTSCLYRFYLLSSALRCWVSIWHPRRNKHSHIMLGEDSSVQSGLKL